MHNPYLKDRQGKTITEWREWTRPKHANHWKGGRSAMELARAWFTSRTPQCPKEIEELLNTHPFTAGIQFIEGVPEYVTGLPGGGGGRNHDLLIRGEKQGQKVIISIEGKADETFGNESVGSYWHKVTTSKKRTNADIRIRELLKIVFGPHAKPNQHPWKDLRYQLLTGVAAAVIEAYNSQAPQTV